MKCPKHPESWIGLNGPGYCQKCARESAELGPSDAATCSRLRETPETDQQSMPPDIAALAGADLVVTAAFAKRLERERDEAREVIRAAAVLIAAKGRHNTMLAYGGLRAAMPPENVNVEARDQ